MLQSFDGSASRGDIFDLIRDFIGDTIHIFVRDDRHIISIDGVRDSNLGIRRKAKAEVLIEQTFFDDSV